MGQSLFLAFIMRLANVFVLTILGVMSLARAKPNEADPTVPEEDSTVPEEDSNVSVDDIGPGVPAVCSPHYPNECRPYNAKPPNITISEENRTVSAEDPTVSEEIGKNTPDVLTSSEHNALIKENNKLTPAVLSSSEEEAFLTQEMDDLTPDFDFEGFTVETPVNIRWYNKDQ